MELNDQQLQLVLVFRRFFRPSAQHSKDYVEQIMQSQHVCICRRVANAFFSHIILGVLSIGLEEAPKHKDKLRLLIVEFHKLFARLSTSLKPKLHHFHHIIDGIEWFW